MTSTIDLLAALATADDHIRDHTRAKERALALVPEADAELAKAEASLAEAKAALAQHAEQEHQTERKVRDYQGHHQRAVRALEMGAGDADAAENQRQKCLAILDELETEQLEQLELRDALQTAIAQAEALVAQQQAAREEAAQRTAPEAALHEEALSRYHSERALLREQIHKEELKRYDALLLRNKRPVSPLVDNACKACRRVLVARYLQELKRGRLVQCSGCARWLHAPELVIEESEPI